MTPDSSERTATARRWPTTFLVGMVFLRLAIGWHFLYEGLVKLAQSDWSAAGYLNSSQWFLADFFHQMAADPVILQWVNWLNISGLILIGLGLMLGVMTRWASIAGILLLALYYVAHPPLLGLDPGLAEGSYLVVNKNVVELFALLLLAIVPDSGFAGLGKYLGIACRRFFGKMRQVASAGNTPLHTDPEGFSRREILTSLATLPVLGGFVYAVLEKRAATSIEERTLQARSTALKPDAVSAPTHTVAEAQTLDQLKGTVQHAQLGHLDVSRIILGGNLMNGYAHARDLMYVAPLVKAYHSVEKVLETLWLAEKCGMNALIINTHVGGEFVAEYHKRNVGKMHFIAQCRTQDLVGRIRRAIDLGAAGAYIQSVEELADKDKYDEINAALDLMRENGMVAGIGSHNIAAIRKCVAQGIEIDFCMKTFHHYDYWSARPNDELKDNRYCDDHDETVEFMRTFEKPWIAFKTLAAGAIPPVDGFRHAFKNGADFVCVGVYDFQVVEDANIAYDIFETDLERERPWQGLA